MRTSIQSYGKADKENEPNFLVHFDAKSLVLRVLRTEKMETEFLSNQFFPCSSKYQEVPIETFLGMYKPYKPPSTKNKVISFCSPCTFDVVVLR